MKVFYILTILLFIGAATDAQQNLFAKLSSKKSRADKLFESFNYPDALKLYLELYHKDPTKEKITLQIAESYRKLNNPAKTAEWYEKIIYDTDLITDENYLYLAQAYLSIQDYERAKIWVKRYKASAGYDDFTFNQSFAYLERLLSHQNKLSVESININTNKDELCPVILPGCMMYMTNRRNPSFINRTDSWTQQSFIDIYKADRLNNKYLSHPKITSLSSQKYNLGPIAFYKSGQSVVYTSNNQKTGTNKLKSLQLYFADVKNGKLQNTKEFPYNENNSSLGHPAINQQGNLLVFASDIPGGYGGSDLYFSFNKNGRWSIPRNLGKTINTAGDELFPYVHNDSVLYFSSNGKMGIGGLDIFYCNLNEEVIPDEPVNPGFPLNTAYDDFGIAISEQNMEGYITSNRPGKGGDDIFYFQLQMIPVYLKIPEGNIVQVDIYENGNLRNSIPSVTDEVALELIPGQNYRIKIYKNDEEQVFKIRNANILHINREYSILLSSGSL